MTEQIEAQERLSKLKSDRVANHEASPQTGATSTAERWRRACAVAIAALATSMATPAIAAPPNGPPAAYLLRCVGGLPWQPSFGFNLGSWLKSDARSGIAASWTKTSDGWILQETNVDQLTTRKIVVRYELVTENSNLQALEVDPSSLQYCDESLSNRVFLRRISVNGAVLTNDQATAMIAQNFSNLIGSDRKPAQNGSRGLPPTPAEPEIVITDEMLQRSLANPKAHPVWNKTNSASICYPETIKIFNKTSSELNFFVLKNNFRSSAPPAMDVESNLGMITPNYFTRWHIASHGTWFIGINSKISDIKVYRIFSPVDCPTPSNLNPDPTNHFNSPED